MTVAAPCAAELTRTFRAMASGVVLRVVEPGPDAGVALSAAAAVFGQVEAACTRFDPASPLMRANANPQETHPAPPLLRAALAEALRAHKETGGLFDPRILATLTGWGYDRSLPFEDGRVCLPAGPAATIPPAGRPPWRPELSAAGVRLGADPVDLGGIGKGLAVRWAAAELAGAGTASLVDAGGDLYAAGEGPEGGGWRIGVESPLGGSEPLAVLALADRGCATSSVRVRRWSVGGRQVHHLIDPRTGVSGGAGLLAVTVVHPDPAWAEVWSKTLFLAGARAVAHAADDRAVAALWVDEQGQVGTSAALAPYLLWSGPHVA